jgi:HlyD family secretion protein
MKKIILLIVIILGGIASFSFIKFSAAKQPLSNGYIEGKYTYLSSPDAGKLISLSVSRGNQVSAGQAIFKLDPNPELAEQLAAKAKLQTEQYNLQNLISGSRNTIIKGMLADKAQAEANLQLAKITLKRNKKLYQHHVIAKSYLDQAQTDYETDVQKLKKSNSDLSEAKLGARKNIILAQQQQTKSAQNDFNKATWALLQKTLNAPEAGLIYNTFYNVGEYVPAGKPVAALLTADNIKVVFFVSERDLSKIKLGGKIKFHADGQTTWRSATIDYISPQAEYTPPLIYSRDSREKLVYRVEAALPKSSAMQNHPGQPLDINYE